MKRLIFVGGITVIILLLFMQCAIYRTKKFVSPRQNEKFIYVGKWRLRPDLVAHEGTSALSRTESQQDSLFVLYIYRAYDFSANNSYHGTLFREKEVDTRLLIQDRYITYQNNSAKPFHENEYDFGTQYTISIPNTVQYIQLHFTVVIIDKRSEKVQERHEFTVPMKRRERARLFFILH